MIGEWLYRLLAGPSLDSKELPELKFCVDCRHFKIIPGLDSDGFCNRTAKTEYNLVTGLSVNRLRRARNERDTFIGDVCGRAARFWEPK